MLLRPKQQNAFQPLDWEGKSGTKNLAEVFKKSHYTSLLDNLKARKKVTFVKKVNATHHLRDIFVIIMQRNTSYKETSLKKITSK